MARVVVTAELPGRWREILADHELIAPTAGEGSLAPDALLRALADAQGLLPLLSVRVDQALLAAAPRLRVVGNYAVGYDNVDVAACTRRRVVLTNTPDVLTPATADLALTLILACARRLPEGLTLARSGQWQGWAPDQLLGLDLDGALLGLVGLGRIGRAVAERARGFGMDVIYAAPRPAPPDVEARLGARRVSLETLCAQADVVSIHCRLSKETHHLVSARELSLMKPTAIVVNTARGPIVDEAALAAALDNGRLFAAGLDVFEEEPAIHPLLREHPRAVVLPHLGSATRGARARMAETAAQGIADVLAGKKPAHPVNPDAL